jgi:DNA-binding response OmpR family regulator
MRSEQMHPTTSDLLNKVREVTVRYPNISQLRDSDRANLATDPAGGVGPPPTANSVFGRRGGLLGRLLAAGRRPWPLTARVPIVSGALILAVAVAVSHFLMSTIAREQELSVRRLAAVYLDGISTTVYPHVVARNLTNTVEALNRTMWFHQGMREQRAMVRLPDGTLFADVSAKQVDDDPIMGESLVQRLQLEGYQAIWWQSGEEALFHLPRTDCRVLVCDIRLPDLDGEQLFRRALSNLGATPVIFITAFGEIEQAVRLMQAGADDYVTKPFEIEVLLDKIAALCAREVVAGNGNPGRETLSASAAMRVVESELLRVTDTSSPVLLLGETGVGKEVAARQLHHTSARRDLPFIVVSCATIPVDRAESEMFGHERGGRLTHRPCRFG